MFVLRPGTGIGVARKSIVRLAPAMQQHIVIDSLHGPVVQSQSISNLADTTTADGRFGFHPAYQPWGDEHVELVNGAGVQKTAENFTAAFDENVGPAATAQVAQECGYVGAALRGLEGHDFAAQSCQGCSVLHRQWPGG